jgi:hypothetical protein
MQPIRGAKKDGVGGFFKGVGKGLGGAILKPGAGKYHRALRENFLADEISSLGNSRLLV